MDRISMTTGDTRGNKTGSWRTMRPIIDKEKCKASGYKCGLCWLFCPDAAIIIDDGGNIVINYDYCKGCGICAEECPRKAIRMTMEGEENE